MVNIAVTDGLVIKSLIPQGLYFGTSLGVSIPITDPPLVSNRLLRLMVTVVEVHSASRAVDLVAAQGIAGAA